VHNNQLMVMCSYRRQPIGVWKHVGVSWLPLQQEIKQKNEREIMVWTNMIGLQDSGQVGKQQPRKWNEITKDRTFRRER